jgi:HTH-type transcriptional regulator/antitoxin HipB
MEQVARTINQIAAAVRRERRLKEMTQAELSQKVKLRQATISRFETGEEGPSLQTLLDILAALNLELVIRPRTKASPKDFDQIF